MFGINIDKAVGNYTDKVCRYKYRQACRNKYRQDIKKKFRTFAAENLLIEN